MDILSCLWSLATQTDHLLIRSSSQLGTQITALSLSASRATGNTVGPLPVRCALDLLLSIDGVPSPKALRPTRELLPN